MKVPFLMLLLAATSAFAEEETAAAASTADCSEPCAKTCPKVGAGKCCLSGEITQRKEDKCGCPIICEGLCTVPEGLPCDPEKDVCADGTKCTIQELSMENEYLGDIWLCQSQMTNIGHKLPDKCMSMLEGALEEEVEKMNKGNNGKGQAGGKPNPAIKNRAARRLRTKRSPKDEKPMDEKPEGEKPEGERPEGDKPEGEWTEDDKPEYKPPQEEYPIDMPDEERPDDEMPEGEDEKPIYMPSEEKPEHEMSGDHEWNEEGKPPKPDDEHGWMPDDHEWQDGDHEWNEEGKPPKPDDEHGWMPDDHEWQDEDHHWEDHDGEDWGNHEGPWDEHEEGHWDEEEGGHEMGMWMGFSNPLKMVRFLAMCGMDVIAEEGRPLYKRKVEKYDQCESIEDEPKLAASLLKHLKKAFENGKGVGKGLMEKGTIEDIKGLSDELMSYFHKIDTEGPPFLSPDKIDPLKEQAYELEQKLWPMLERLGAEPEFGDDEDHDDHDDHDGHDDHDEHEKELKPDEQKPKPETEDEMEMEKQPLKEEDIIEKLDPLHSHAMSAFGKLDMRCWGTIVLLIIGLVQ